MIRVIKILLISGKLIFSSIGRQALMGATYSAHYALIFPCGDYVCINNLFSNSWGWVTESADFEVFIFFKPCTTNFFNKVLRSQSARESKLVAQAFLVPIALEIPGSQEELKAKVRRTQIAGYGPCYSLT